MIKRERIVVSKKVLKDYKRIIESAIILIEDTPLKDRQIEQVLKSIHCYLYQCSEGDINKLPLYKTLRNIDYILSSHIINQLPLYDSAEWA